MRILAVDTALGACSCAVLENTRVASHRFVVMERGHAEALAPMVEEAMRESGIAFAELDRLAVTTGPGTFTGQRVGLAFMRGMRIALKRPLIGITTLEAMAHQAMAETGAMQAASLHDAKRDEVYLETIPGSGPSLMPFDDAVALLATKGVIALAGTAAPHAAETLPEAVLSSVRQPDALWVARLALSREAASEAPKPLYLRPPDAKLPAQRLA
jgi:tRNA threonylcarbamoyladenosine biosynthesis protein TsaB